MNLPIYENYSMSGLTSFKTGGPARYFIHIENIEILVEALAWAASRDLEILVIGGGSNMVVSDSGVDALVLRIGILGKSKLKEDEHSILVEIGAGEVWDQVVLWSVENDWCGLENLSHIPGFTGALAVQNVGAYGQEASRIIESVRAYDRTTKRIVFLNNPECAFGYRKSIFNHDERGRYIILSVCLRLLKSSTPSLGYPDIQKYLSDHELQTPNLKQIRSMIIEIRDKKLPLPDRLGNVGSFFKNLMLDDEKFIKLEDRINSVDILLGDRFRRFKETFTRDGLTKIPTAFLIEASGLKGFCMNGVCVHRDHALVLVNDSGKALSHDIMELFRHVRRAVFEKWGVEIVNEPELIGFTSEEIERYFNLQVIV